jgi:hypothetical protein
MAEQSKFPVVEIISGIPGCGKTTAVMREFKDKPEANVLLVVTLISEMKRAETEGGFVSTENVFVPSKWSIDFEEPDMGLVTIERAARDKVEALHFLLSKGGKVVTTHQNLINIIKSPRQLAAIGSLLLQGGYECVIDEQPEMLKPYFQKQRSGMLDYDQKEVESEIIKGNITFDADNYGKLHWSEAKSYELADREVKGKRALSAFAKACPYLYGRYEVIPKDFTGDIHRARRTSKQSSENLERSLVIIQSLTPKWLTYLKRVRVLTYMPEGREFTTWMRQHKIDSKITKLPEPNHKSLNLELVAYNVKLVDQSFSASYFGDSRRFTQEKATMLEKAVDYERVKRKISWDKVAMCVFKENQGEFNTLKANETPVITKTRGEKKQISLEFESPLEPIISTAEGNRIRLTGKKAVPDFWISVGCLGTNEYEDKDMMVYVINYFPAEGLAGWCDKFDLGLDRNRCTLQNIIQWSFRGSIRKQRELQDRPMAVYFTSVRCWDLFHSWLYRGYPDKTEKLLGRDGVCDLSNQVNRQSFARQKQLSKRVASNKMSRVKTVDCVKGLISA